MKCLGTSTRAELLNRAIMDSLKTRTLDKIIPDTQIYEIGKYIRITSDIIKAFHTTT